MRAVRYRPDGGGDAWRAAVTGTAVAVLPPEVTPHAVEAVWRRLDVGGLGAVLESLTGAFGTSLTAIPPFGFAVAEGDGIRVAARGQVELVIETASGVESVSGGGVSTWTERFLPGALRVSVDLGVEASADDLPIESGVVSIASLVLSLASVDRAPSGPVAVAPAPASGAAPVRPPSPESPPMPQVAPAEAPVRPIAAADPPVPEPAPEPAPSGTPASHDTIASIGDPQLGETIASPRKPAAPSVPPVPSLPPFVPPAPPASPILGDHDGATISVAEARALRGGTAPAYDPVEDVPTRTPAQGRIRLADGRIFELERTVVVGRRPRSTRPAEAELPTLIAVDGPQHDISRNHVEIRSEGENVLAVDLASTNGTVLLRGGHDPVRLHPNEPTMVVNADVLDLGDGVTLTFEDLP